jgi:hypothetical protein
MLRSNDANHMRAISAVLAFGCLLAGCSDLYFDRRETVTFGAGDAVAANAIQQTIDPWPRASANRDFSSNGARTAGAIERYRTGKIIQPLGTSTSSVNYGAAPTVGQGGAPILGTPGAASPSN